MSNLLFVAENDYVAESEGELSFNVGDEIKIINNESEWWYGEMVKSGEKGWVAPSFGKLVDTNNPYNRHNEREKTNKRKELFIDILRTEANYINDLSVFFEAVVLPLQKLDTPFKRSFMNESSVAVSFTLLQDIHIASQSYHTSLQKAGSAEQMARCYIEFAPSLQLYSQYISENTACLIAIKSYHKQLREFATKLPDNLSIEEYLVLPLSHFNTYGIKLQEFVWLTPTSRPEYKPLSDALQEVIIQTEKVSKTLTDLSASVKLYALQNKFVNHPKIFTRTRRLLQEGEMSRLRMINNVLTGKTYYAHLFNDCLMWSQMNNAGKFKLNRAWELDGTSISAVAIPNFPYCFLLKNKTEQEIFSFPTQELYNRWFTEIDKVIQTYTINTGNTWSSKDMSTDFARLSIHKTLGSRGLLIQKFLIQESKLSELLMALNVAVFQPLIDASHGGVLWINTKGNTGKPPDETSVSKVKREAIKDLLKSSDIQIFLRAAEALTAAIKELIHDVQSKCADVDWSESIQLGSCFLSTNAKVLYKQYKSYASGVQRCILILKGPYFTDFYQSAEQALSGYPGKLSDNLEIPKNRPSQYYEFLTNLLKLTPNAHMDRHDLTDSCLLMESVTKELENVTKDMRNFNKLLEIQSSLVPQSSMFSTSQEADQFIQKLASTERKFIKESDMKKVCRKSNKIFRFWLFNDYICYGSGNGNGTFTLHRYIDLSTVKLLEVTNMTHSTQQTIQTSFYGGSQSGNTANGGTTGGTKLKGQYKHCFELLSKEKSFTIICNSESEKLEWMEKIYQYSQSIKLHKGLNEDTINTAALWEQDNKRTTCAVCNQGFGVFRRRHHCRKCGRLVCGDHSRNSAILKHIDATKKQRICDDCQAGKQVHVPTTSVPYTSRTHDDDRTTTSKLSDGPTVLEVNRRQSTESLNSDKYRIPTSIVAGGNSSNNNSTNNNTNNLHSSQGTSTPGSRVVMQVDSQHSLNSDNSNKGNQVIQSITPKVESFYTASPRAMPPQPNYSNKMTPSPHTVGVPRNQSAGVRVPGYSPLVPIDAIDKPIEMKVMSDTPLNMGVRDYAVSNATADEGISIVTSASSRINNQSPERLKNISVLNEGPQSPEKTSQFITPPLPRTGSRSASGAPPPPPPPPVSSLPGVRKPGLGLRASPAVRETPTNSTELKTDAYVPKGVQPSYEPRSEGRTLPTQDISSLASTHSEIDSHANHKSVDITTTTTTHNAQDTTTTLDMNVAPSVPLNLQLPSSPPSPPRRHIEVPPIVESNKSLYDSVMESNGSSHSSNNDNNYVDSRIDSINSYTSDKEDKYTSENNADTTTNTMAPKVTPREGLNAALLSQAAGALKKNPLSIDPTAESSTTRMSSYSTRASMLAGISSVKLRKVDNTLPTSPAYTKNEGANSVLNTLKAQIDRRREYINQSSDDSDSDSDDGFSSDED